MRHAVAFRCMGSFPCLLGTVRACAACRTCATTTQACSQRAMGDAMLCYARSGDHTVKITEVASGKVARVLLGHRRTPWVVSCPAHGR